MPRKENFDAQIAFRCYSGLKEQLEVIAAENDETDPSAAARLLLLRGIAAYYRDHRLSEPSGPVGRQKSGRQSNDAK